MKRGHANVFWDPEADNSFFGNNRKIPMNAIVRPPTLKRQADADDEEQIERTQSALKKSPTKRSRSSKKVRVSIPDGSELRKSRASDRSKQDINPNSAFTMLAKAKLSQQKQNELGRDLMLSIM